VRGRVDRVARVVIEPRTSAKRSVHSISAPPWFRSMNVKQVPHRFGFWLDGLLSVSRTPMPPNGAAQRRQRGSCGIIFMTRRTLCSFE
jgi:hypothetical protein